jgi:hypothetical protein
MRDFDQLFQSLGAEQVSQPVSSGPEGASLSGPKMPPMVLERWPADADARPDFHRPARHGHLLPLFARARRHPLTTDH